MTAETEVEVVQRLIAQLPPDSQRRVEVVANTLRELLAAYEMAGNQEVELAFTLVMAELAS